MSGLRNGADLQYQHFLPDLRDGKIVTVLATVLATVLVTANVG